MARTTWQVYEEGSGGGWSALTTIVVPNMDLQEDIVSTMNKLSLADGTIARLTPEQEYLSQPLSMNWVYLEDSTLYNNLKSWATTGKYLKISTHLSGIEFVGYFTSVRRVWSIAKTEWNVTAAFDVRDL